MSGELLASTRSVAKKGKAHYMQNTFASKHPLAVTEAKSLHEVKYDQPNRKPTHRTSSISLKDALR